MNRLPTILSRCTGMQQIQSEFDLIIAWNHMCIWIVIHKFEFSFTADVCRREFHVTGINFDIVWRRNRRLPKNPTSSGPLTDLPDYTFIDGRPTPLGVRHKSYTRFRWFFGEKKNSNSYHVTLLLFKLQTRQMRRLDKQRDIATKIVQKIKEVDFAKENYKQNLLATEKSRQSILDSKLKPKGKLFTKKE